MRARWMVSFETTDTTRSHCRTLCEFAHTRYTADDCDSAGDDSAESAAEDELDALEWPPRADRKMRDRRRDAV